MRQIGSRIASSHTGLMAGSPPQRGSRPALVNRSAARNGRDASVVRPTLLYTHSEAVIPAPDRSRGQALAGIQPSKTGFRVKPGMTIKVKGLSTHYTSRNWPVTCHQAV